jgi:hypothetical protein
MQVLTLYTLAYNEKGQNKTRSVAKSIGNCVGILVRLAHQEV